MEPISLATLPAVACIIAVLTQHWSYGFATVIIAHVAWLEIFGLGLILPVSHIYSFYTWAILLSAAGGHVISRIFNWHPLLNGRYLLTLRRNDVKKTVNPESKEISPSGPKDGWPRFLNITARVLFGLTLLICAHIPLELQVNRHDWPVWAGGLTTTGALVLVWTLIWALLRYEQTTKGGIIFKAQAVETEQQKHESVVNLHNELKSFIFYFGLTHIAYVTVYWIVWASVSDTVWLTQSWWFYTSLCVAGGIFIIMAAVGLGLRFAPMSPATYSPVPTAAQAGFKTLF
jgi:hypothetical protein